MHRVIGIGQKEETERMGDEMKVSAVMGPRVREGSGKGGGSIRQIQRASGEREGEGWGRNKELAVAPDVDIREEEGEESEEMM